MFITIHVPDDDCYDKPIFPDRPGRPVKRTRSNKEIRELLASLTDTHPGVNISDMQSNVENTKE